MPVKEIFKMDFLEEKVFDREQYDTYIRRIHYDDRDAVMYEKNAPFPFPLYCGRTRDRRSRGTDGRIYSLE